MKTWSKIRDKLENDYLAPSLRGHVRYFVTTYRESHDREGRAAILLDGEEIFSSNYYEFEAKTRELFLKPSDTSSPGERHEQVWRGAENAGAFDQHSFYHAFDLFDNQSIEESLSSDRLLVRIFALMDRRVGKRRLAAMRDAMEQADEVTRRFYDIRMRAEGLAP